MKNRQSDFFWPSFSDLMTSLFFIMLVLYVLTYLTLRHQQQVTEFQLQQMREIQTAVKKLPPEYFTYDTLHKRFLLNRNIEFPPEQAVINGEDGQYLGQVGHSIKALIDTLKAKYAGQDIRYVIIIEGMASIDRYPDNYPLSYRRAWAVRKLWDSLHIDLDTAVCEVQIAGSGTGGVGRFPHLEETRNQRILIQIVPKIGELKPD